MPFTARDLRYQAELHYPLLYAYLHRNAQRFLGSLKYDAFEVDTVIGHVVEQLVRLGLLGGVDHTPLTALDLLTDAQFYAFLCRSVRNKAIDRLRKRRLLVNTTAELEMPDEENDGNPLDEAVESVWGSTPFSTPEALALQLASQKHLRDLLKHCIMVLSAAPNQLQAVIYELQEMGADDLLQSILADLQISLDADVNPHMSQHKDHAHKKLRLCLQQQSSNLSVIIALRLTQYKAGTSTQTTPPSAEAITGLAKKQREQQIPIDQLAQPDLTQADVREGLTELAREGLITWHGEDVLLFTAEQAKRLARFYKEEE